MGVTSWAVLGLCQLGHWQIQAIFWTGWGHLSLEGFLGQLLAVRLLTVDLKGKLHLQRQPT